MIVTGSQIRAARALLGWTRSDLANAAKLHNNSVAYWEGHAVIPTGGYQEPHACRRIREALRIAGVETFIDPSAGVRFVPQSQLTHQYARGRAHAHHGVLGDAGLV